MSGRDTVYRYLYETARRGDPLPINSQIFRFLQFTAGLKGSPDVVHKAVYNLANKQPRKIVLRRRGPYRQIEIVSTGARTKWAHCGRGEKRHAVTAEVRSEKRQVVAVEIRTPTERKCLGGCGGTFYSAHPPAIERLCRVCRKKDHGEDYRVAL